ncbi:MAG: ABC transporter six-transmembrane domain-containing protein [Bacteroidota bacterium]
MKLQTIFKAYRFKFIFTLALLLLEAGLAILFPLFIGYAIDSVINGSSYGALQLGVLGLLTLLVGVSRRIYDSRFYAQVYQRIGLATMPKMDTKAPSKKVARLSMIRELVEFLENALPELIGNLIGLIGVMAIIAALNLKVFYGSLVVTLLIFLIYWLTSAKTIRLNRAANDELEQQVDVIAKNSTPALQLHLSNTMKWNIKLSDLEAANFSASWILLIGFLIAAIIMAAGDGIIKYGALFSLIMYVFQYMENVINLPLFYQNWLRLWEIRRRLEQE